MFKFFQRFFSIRANPSREAGLILTLLPFVLVLGAYFTGAHLRHQVNPRDKIMPTLPEMATSMKEAVLELDAKEQMPVDLPEWKQTLFTLTHSQLAKDTAISGKRFLISIGLLWIGVFLGLHMGLLPYAESLTMRFILLLDKIPAVAILPILYIVFGLGESTKIVFAFIGVFPTVVLDVYNQVKGVPGEQLTKGLTLAASNMEIAYSIVLPKLMPRILNTLRLNFKAVIGFLLFAETIASNEGLGYRIFLSMRYLKMSTILPYVAWISLLAFTADLAVRMWVQWRYPWTDKE